MTEMTERPAERRATQSATQSAAQRAAERATFRDGSALRQLLRAPEPTGAGVAPSGVDLEPGCAYGVVTRAMVDALLQEIRIIRGRVDSLLSLVIGAIVLDVLLRLAGLR